MRRTTVIAILAALAALPADAGMLSRTFRFKPGVQLEVGETTEDGLRLDSVRFSLPATVGGDNMRTGGLAEVEVSVSNTSQEGVRSGVAVAVFDDEGRPLGVSSAGSQITALKAGRQKTFRMAFDHVNRELYRGTTFLVTVESRR